MRSRLAASAPVYRTRRCTCRRSAARTAGREGQFPNAERIARETVTLPLHAGMSDSRRRPRLRRGRRCHRGSARLTAEHGVSQRMQMKTDSAAFGRDPGLQRGGRPAGALRAPLSGPRCAAAWPTRSFSSTTAAATARRRCCASNGSVAATSRASCCSTRITASTRRSSPGFERCRGERVVTLDADLQNPPEEIAKLLAAMDAGHDYVGGVRRTREDSCGGAWRRAR